MSFIDKEELVRICSIPVGDFEKHTPKVPYRIVKDSAGMGDLMSEELIQEIVTSSGEKRETRAIIPCGPSCWYEPFTRKVNERKISLRNLKVFHMDEFLDWEGKLLPDAHPLNFRTTMEKLFYSPVSSDLAVPEENRFWMAPELMDRYKKEFWKKPIDICLGGWGQDGHIAYNQARRDPYRQLRISELKEAEMRIQVNNQDTVFALAHRNFGAAYQLIPPMSCTIGMKECLSAKKIRLFSDTGSWKQTAFRAALFGPVCVEYPITLLQEHPDACLTATVETAGHPLDHNPQWRFTED